MTRKSNAQLKQIVRQWTSAGPELERRRRAELRSWVYDWRAVDALLEIGSHHAAPRPTSGLVEQQRWFRKLAERQRP